MHVGNDDLDPEVLLADHDDVEECAGSLDAELVPSALVAGPGVPHPLALVYDLLLKHVTPDDGGDARCCRPFRTYAVDPEPEVDPLPGNPARRHHAARITQAVIR